MSGVTRKDVRIFDCYNVKTACMQVELSTSTGENKKGEVETKSTVFITMAPTIDKNVNMTDVQTGKIKKVFNYDEKIKIALEWQEVASIAKYKQPFYAKRIGEPIIDSKTGQQQTYKNKPQTYGEYFPHKHPYDKEIFTSFNMNTNTMDPMGCAMYMSQRNHGNTRKCMIYLSGDELYHLAMALEHAMLIHFMRDVKEYTFTPKSSKNTGNYNNNYNNNDKQNQQAEDRGPSNAPVDVSSLLG